jgi:hypothetical protein
VYRHNYDAKAILRVNRTKHQTQCSHIHFLIPLWRNAQVLIATLSTSFLAIPIPQNARVWRFKSDLLDSWFIEGQDYINAREAKITRQIQSRIFHCFLNLFPEKHVSSSREVVESGEGAAPSTFRLSGTPYKMGPLVVTIFLASSIPELRSRKRSF